MKINREKIMDALSKVLPGLASKEIMEQSKSFVFQNNKVYTYNSEIAICHPIQLEFADNVAIPAEQFYKLLTKTNDVEIDISIDRSELIIKTKRSMAGIPINDKINLPLDEIEEAGKFYRLSESFIEGIKFCYFSVSNDLSRPILASLRIKDNTITSCDGYRLTRFEMTNKSKEFILPSLAAKELTNYKPVAVSITENWLHFKTEEKTVFSCRTIEGEWPDIEEFLNVKGKKIAIPSRLKEMLERAEIFAESEFEKDRLVKINIKDNKFYLSGKGSYGWFKEGCKIKYSGNPLTFMVDPKFLKDTISILDKITVDETKLKLEGDNFIHIISLTEEE